MDDMSKAIWENWRTVRKIGAGNYGSVYEIRRKVGNVQDIAALKVVSIPQDQQEIEELYFENYDSESITAHFKSYMQDILSEYECMTRLKGCRNIVYTEDVKCVQHDDGIGWDILIKMELLTPLAKTLEKVIPENMVIKLGIDMCNALLTCSAENIVHRDIKPQNIFVAKDGTYKLGDFGIAKTVEKTTGGTIIGTYKYMAPEVYNNRPYGATVDMYSLGLVLYWLLNELRGPFLPLPPEKVAAGITEKARERRMRGEQIPPPAHGSTALQQIVLKACAYDPENRYKNVAEMMADLLKLPYQPYVIPAAIMEKLREEEASVCDRQIEDKTAEGVGGVIPTTPPVIKGGTIASEWRNGETQLDNGGTLGPGWRGGNVTQPKAPPSDEREAGTSRSRWKILIAVAAAAICLLLGIFILMGRNGTSWSEWSDTLPAKVSTQMYDIEERVLYSSRQKEIKISDSDKVGDGWTLVNASGSGNSNGWSDWSKTPITATNQREVETQQRYRYRLKETTTSEQSSLSGWYFDSTEQTSGEFGQWSDWSTDVAYENDSRRVESKTQYRYRDISYSSDYSDWSSWSSWQDNYVGSNDTTKVETRTVYMYCYFQCYSCGQHMHGWGFTCPTWAGGCGRAVIQESSYHEVWGTTPQSQMGFKDWHGTGHTYSYYDGELVFRNIYGDQSKTQYRYATRSTVQKKSYGSWSSWTDTSYSPSGTREVESRTVYRYCDRGSKAMNTFYRWGNWSEWTAASVSPSSTCEVETAVFYRYREQDGQKKYRYERWTDWSNYSDNAVIPSDDLEVRTKTQYRYREKN